jgi:hypothetical protein
LHEAFVEAVARSRSYRGRHAVEGCRDPRCRISLWERLSSRDPGRPAAHDLNAIACRSSHSGRVWTRLLIIKNQDVTP